MNASKTKVLKGLILAMGLALSSSLAVANDNVKVGFISIDRILREATPAKKALQKLEKEFAPRDAEIQKLTKQAKDLQTVLEKESVTLSEADRRNKEADLGRINRDLQRLQREFREDLNARRNEELSQVIERANKVVQQIAEAEKFDLILQEAVFRSARIDITEKVLKALTDK